MKSGVADLIYWPCATNLFLKIPVQVLFYTAEYREFKAARVRFPVREPNVTGYFFTQIFYR